MENISPESGVITSNTNNTNSSKSLNIAHPQTLQLAEEKEILDTLQVLHECFVSLVTKVKEALEQNVDKGNPTITTLMRFIQTYIHWENMEFLVEIEDLNQLFSKLHRYFDFLECGLIIAITNEFIGGELSTKMKEHKEKALELRRQQSVKNLKDKLHKIYNPHLQNTSNMPEVYIKLNEVGKAADIEGLYLLVKYLLPKTKQQSLLQHITIDSSDNATVNLQDSPKTKEGKLLKMTFEIKEKDRSITNLESSEVMLKEEVDHLKLYERDKELFIEECKKGEIKIHPVKCILSGLPRVGKTSFLSRLQGKKPLDDSPSTGIERPVSITILEPNEPPVSISILEQTNFAAAIINKMGKWVHTNNVLEEGYLLLQHVKQLKASSSEEATTDTSEDSSDDSLDHFNKPVETASSIKPSGDNETTNSKEMEQQVHESFLPVHEFLSQASSAQQILENLKESTTVYFMDTGGQPEFHELLPPILHGPALHLIFFNASLDLNKAVQIHYCHKEEIESFKYTSNSSSIEILHQLLSSFYFLQEKSNSVLLGSHVDLLDIDESQCHIMINKISDLLKQHMEETDYYKNAFLTFPTDSNNIFLPIDNKTASEEELEQIKKFLEIVFNRFEAVPLPITWAAFHLILRYKYEKSGVCTITDCEDLAEKCGIKRENVVPVLRFLHNNVGTILYYENVDSLNELVICDPNVLFHGLSHLVTVSFAGSGVNYTIADTIRKTGVIPQHVLDKAKSQDQSSPLNAQHLINLLKHYKLIKEVNQNDDIFYFMPCLLQLDNLTSSLSAGVVKDLDTPPLVIMFQGGFIPLGVFSSLVIELSSKWKYDTKTLYRNHVDFNARSHRVELRSCFTYLEIRITAYDKPSFHCYQTRTFLKQCINNVLQSQRHTARIKVSEGVYCPGSFSCPSLHMCEYEDGYLTCTAKERCREYINPFPLENYPFQICWFEDNPSFSGQALPFTDDVFRLPTRSTNGRRQRREEEIESNATEGPGVDVSPHDILKTHLVQLIDVITTPDRLADGLFATNLISNAVKDRVLSQNLSRQDKARILVHEVLKSLSAFKDPKTLISFCDVLKNQDDPDLFRIANTMLRDLGIEIQLPSNERSSSMTDEKVRKRQFEEKRETVETSTPRSTTTNTPTNSDKKLPTGKSEVTVPLYVIVLIILFFVFAILINILVDLYLY